jgi:nucleoid-associated protein YgaU
MSDAKASISRAEEVKADKYAPAELKKAQESLFKCHDQIAGEDMKKAAEEALSSQKAAEEAISKSLPLLAKDYLEESRTTISEAERFYAEKFAPEDFQSAQIAAQAAEELYSASAFYESYRKSLEAIRYGTEAKNKALAGAPGLKMEIDRIKTDTNSLEQNRGAEFAAEDLNTAKTALGDAESLMAQNSLKDTALKIGEADTALKAAQEKTHSAIAAEKLSAAKISLGKVRESDLKDQFTGDIDKAALLIEEASSLLEAKSFVLSIEKSDEALTLLNSVIISMEQKMEELRMKEQKAALGGLKDGGVSAEGFPREYVVQFNPKKRDCLWRIAHTVYRNARLWPLIYVSNRDQIKDPDLIFPGQRFTIPSPPAVKKSDSSGPAGLDARKPEGKESVVPNTPSDE